MSSGWTMAGVQRALPRGCCPRVAELEGCILVAHPVFSEQRYMPRLCSALECLPTTVRPRC